MATQSLLESMTKKIFSVWIPSRLTCKDHDGGCNLIHIHCCRWRTNIPSPVSGQVSHDVVNPWTVKHMKFGYNYTGYQMVEQQSSWKVRDTMNVSISGRGLPCETISLLVRKCHEFHGPIYTKDKPHSVGMLGVFS